MSSQYPSTNSKKRHSYSARPRLMNVDNDTYDIGKPDCDRGQSAKGELALSSMAPRQPVVATGVNSLDSSPRPGSDQDEPLNALKNFPAGLEVGLPPDHLWDYDAAYDRRFCFDHGETEYLFGAAKRWMSFGDFDIPNITALLELGLQSHKDKPMDFDPYSRKCQAECHGSLWSHVHSVVDRYEHDGASLYLVQWKVCG